jgi:hypothetical protein
MVSLPSVSLTPELESLGVVHWVGILTALVSAAVHLLLGARLAPTALGVSFLLAGAGFLAGIGAVVVGWRRRAVYALGVPFTLGQVLLWYGLNFADGSKSFPADIGALGAVDKLAQVVLLAVLVAVLVRGESRV